MKSVIINNVIEASDITVGEEDTSYPKEYMLNNYPRLHWKGTNILGNAVTITISMPTQSNTIALFDIEATEVVFTLKDSSNVTIETTTYDMDALTSYYEMTVGTFYQNMQRVPLWIDYTFLDDNHTITLDIKNESGAVPEIGIMRGGMSYNLAYNPRAGLQEGLVDYSIKKKNINGSDYYSKKPIIRTFSGSSLVSRDEEFYYILYRIAQLKGEEPLAWKVTSLGSDQWAVFAKLDGMPTGSHDLPAYSNLSWRLTEAL